MMESNVAKLIEKLRGKFPEQLAEDPILDQIEEIAVGEEEPVEEGEYDLDMPEMPEEGEELGELELEDEDEDEDEFGL